MERPVGTMYICWSFDGTTVPLQQIVVMRSRDGGRTWGVGQVHRRLPGLGRRRRRRDPFWNDTQLNSLPAGDPEHSPYQEVFAARVPNRSQPAPPERSRCVPKRQKIGLRSIGRPSLNSTRALVGKRLGPPARTARACCATACPAAAAPWRRSRRPGACASRPPRRAATSATGSDAAARAGPCGAPTASGCGAFCRASTASRRRPIATCSFGVRKGKVNFVAVADSRLVINRKALRTQLRRAALIAKR